VKLLVTGAGGGLGRALIRWAGAEARDHTLSALTHDDLDIADEAAVSAAVDATQPDVIINCAAFTKVDVCEADPEAAFRGNAIGPRNLAVSAASRGTVLLHVSTDYVFDGEKGEPYNETDVPRPQSVYAKSKLAGEEFVRGSLDRHFIVRTGFVFGGGADFLSGAVAQLASGERVGGLSDRIGTPTFVQHSAARLLALVETQRFGTFHLAGPEATTWFEVLGRLKRLGGLSGEPEEQHAADLGLAAPRPRNSALVSLYLDGLGVPPMPDLDVALKEFLDERGS
jgi:dTDP-4-dehydrorhamnose reductase